MKILKLLQELYIELKVFNENEDLEKLNKNIEKLNENLAALLENEGKKSSRTSLEAIKKWAGTSE